MILRRIVQVQLSADRFFKALKIRICKKMKDMSLNLAEIDEILRCVLLNNTIVNIQRFS